MNHDQGDEFAFDNFDLLTATVTWVAKGTPPDSVVATESFPPEGASLKYAHYRGQRDPEDATENPAIVRSRNSLIRTLWPSSREPADHEMAGRVSTQFYRAYRSVCCKITLLGWPTEMRSVYCPGYHNGYRRPLE